MQTITSPPLPEFVYTSTITAVQAGGVATIEGLWKTSISCVLINMAVFIGLNGLSMMVPPWRSARAQLHSKAHDVLQVLASRFEAVAQGRCVLQALASRFEAVAQGACCMH